MRAGDVTLRSLFADNHRYEIPMFQRPYVWGAEHEWAPLWDDISAAADGVVAEMMKDEYPEEPPRYFLGSIVVKDTDRHPQRLGGSLLVDGQQRLTTLQILLASARSVADAIGAPSAVGRFGAWLINDEGAVHENYPDDRYKLWPLPQDREPYLWAVRDLTDDRACPVPDHQVTRARAWFEDAIRVWAGDGDDAGDRLDALHSALKDRMQVAKITLEKTDNAQVIFEALNHRGVELSQSDLIKNLLFRLVEAQGQRKEAESLLVDHWLPLDGPRWRVPVTTGRIVRSRLDLVLAYWLTAKVQDSVSVEHLFDEFKTWMLDGQHNAAKVIQAIRLHADLYDQLRTTPPDTATAELVDHIVATKTNTVWPLLLTLFAGDRGVPKDQRGAAVAAIGSYLMRRGVCGLTTKDYNKAFVSVLNASHAVQPSSAGNAVHDALAGFTGESRVWPSDHEFMGAMLASNFYSLGAARVRTFFTGIENHLRDALAEESTLIQSHNTKLNIEHILPQAWHKHWPLPTPEPGDDPEEAMERGTERRDTVKNWLGNLTLTNGKLNSKMQNEQWSSKKHELQAKSTLLITTASVLTPPSPEAASKWDSGWDEATIGVRTNYLIGKALETWRGAGVDTDDETRWRELDEPEASAEAQGKEEDEDHVGLEELELLD